ncbi:MAG: RHS repeat-associated core domain-containing protein [Candidatus Shapirobacteria bacterium]|jgi:RHS repeat-associated protein
MKLSRPNVFPTLPFLILISVFSLSIIIPKSLKHNSSAVSSCQSIPFFLYGSASGDWDQYECLNGRWLPKNIRGVSSGSVLASTDTTFSIDNVQAPSVKDFTTSTQTGDATINYPLSLAPAAGGFTPSLSINYSSGGIEDMKVGFDEGKWKESFLNQGSHLGMGWSLSGIPSIMKNSVGKYFLVLNGQSFEVVFDESTTEAKEKVVIDDSNRDQYDKGKKATKKAYFKTSPQTYLRIIRNTTTSPDWDKRTWDIWAKDGTLYHFEPLGFVVTRELSSKSAACGTQFKVKRDYNKWLVTQATNPSGDTINYSYSSETKLVNGDCTGCGDCSDFGGSSSLLYPINIYPTTISYGKNNSSKIVFNYSPRTDYQFDDWDNPNRVNFYTKNKLSSIDIYLGSLKLRSYILNYLYADKPNGIWKSGNLASGRLMLSSISLLSQGKEFPVKATYTYYSSVSSTPYLLSLVNNGYGAQVSYEYETQLVNPNVESSRYQYTGQTIKRNAVKTKKTFDTLNPSAYSWVTYDYTRNDNCQGYQDSCSISSKSCPNVHATVLNNFYADYEFYGFHYVTETLFSTDNSGATATKHNAINYTFNQGTEGSKSISTSSGWDCRSYFEPTLLKGTIAKTVNLDSSGNPLAVSSSIYALDAATNLLYLQESKSCSSLTDTSDPVLRPGSYSASSISNYDSYGNIKQANDYYVSKCSLAGTNLYSFSPNISSTDIFPLKSTYSYYSYLDNSTKYIVDKPNSTLVTDQTNSNKIIGSIWYFYDGNEANLSGGNPHLIGPTSRGLLTATVTNDSNQLTSSRAAITTINSRTTYDNFGNPTVSIVYADYGKMEKKSDGLYYLSWPRDERKTTTTYDLTYAAFPKSQTISPSPFTNNTTTAYDFESGAGLGLPISVTDQNLLTTSTQYDPFGRVIAVIQPGDSVSSPTTKVTYYDYQPSTVNAPFAVKQEQKEVGGRYLSTYVFYNSLGQKLQTQSEAPHKNTKRLFIDLTKYDALGKPIIQYSSQDIHEDRTPGCQRYLGFYSTCIDTSFSARTLYDTLDRPVTQISPDGTCSKTKYEGKKTSVYDKDANLAVAVSTVLEGNRLYDRGYVFTKTNKSLTLNCSDNSLPNQSNYSVYTASEKISNIKGEAIVSNIKNSSGGIISQSTTSFDGLGRVTSSFDPDLGRTDIFNQNALGQILVTKKVNDTAQTSIIRSTSYDVLGRPLAVYEGDCYSGSLVCSPSSLKPLLLNEYDTESIGGTKAKGKLVKETTPGVVVKTTRYDGGRNNVVLGLPSLTTIALVDPSDNFLNNLNSLNETYSYDELGRNKTSAFFSNPSRPELQETLTTTYDSIGRLSSITSDKSNQPLINNITYDKFGQITQKTLGGLITEKLAYDEANKSLRLKTHSATSSQGVLLSLSYNSYDKLGNITSLTDNLVADNTKTFAYTYDSFSRLVSVSGPYSAAYSYDELSRLNKKVEKDSLIFAFSSFNSASPMASFPLNAPKSVNRNSLIYDSRGNLTKSLDKTYVFDTDDRLTNVKDLNNKILSSFIYSAGGVRIKKTDSDKITYYLGSLEIEKNLAVSTTTPSASSPSPTPPKSPSPTPAGSTASNCSSRCSWGLTQCQRDSATLTGGACQINPACPGVPDDNYTSYWRWSYCQKTVLGVTDTAVKTTIRISYPASALREIKYDSSNNVLSNKLYFILSDHLTSTKAVVDDTGAKVSSSADYYPYGEERTSVTSNFPTNRLYTGQIKDNTGLYYYNARYYDPHLGVFISADYAQGPNRYAYVGGNPIMKNDPSGNQSNYLDKYDQYKKTQEDLKERFAGLVGSAFNMGPYDKNNEILWKKRATYALEYAKYYTYQGPVDRDIKKYSGQGTDLFTQSTYSLVPDKNYPENQITTTRSKLFEVLKQYPETFTSNIVWIPEGYIPRFIDKNSNTSHNFGKVEFDYIASSQITSINLAAILSIGFAESGFEPYSPSMFRAWGGTVGMSFAGDLSNNREERESYKFGGIGPGSILVQMRLFQGYNGGGAGEVVKNGNLNPDLFKYWNPGSKSQFGFDEFDRINGIYKAIQQYANETNSSWLMENLLEK